MHQRERFQFMRGVGVSQQEGAPMERNDCTVGDYLLTSRERHHPPLLQCPASCGGGPEKPNSRLTCLGPCRRMTGWRARPPCSSRRLRHRSPCADAAARALAATDLLVPERGARP